MLKIVATGLEPLIWVPMATIALLIPLPPNPLACRAKSVREQLQPILHGSERYRMSATISNAARPVPAVQLAPNPSCICETANLRRSSALLSDA